MSTFRLQVSSRGGGGAGAGGAGAGAAVSAAGLVPAAGSPAPRQDASIAARTNTTHMPGNVRFERERWVTIRAHSSGRRSISRAMTPLLLYPIRTPGLH